MSCFKVSYYDLSLEEIIDLVNEDDLPDTILHRRCRICDHLHKRIGTAKKSVKAKMHVTANKLRSLVGKSPVEKPQPVRELFTPASLVCEGDPVENDNTPLQRVTTGRSIMSAMSTASSVVSLTPSRLQRASRASGMSEQDMVDEYLNHVLQTQPPRLTSVENPLFSERMVAYIQQLQKEYWAASE